MDGEQTIFSSYAPPPMKKPVKELPLKKLSTMKQIRSFIKRYWVQIGMVIGLCYSVTQAYLLVLVIFAIRDYLTNLAMIAGGHV